MQRWGAVALQQCCVQSPSGAAAYVTLLARRRHWGASTCVRHLAYSASPPERRHSSSRGGWVMAWAQGPEPNPPHHHHRHQQQQQQQQQQQRQQQYQPAPQRQRYYSSTSNAVLSNTTSFLRNLHNGAEIFLVGTAHVSKKSAEEVRDMIRLVKPGSVMVELCPQRAARLRAGNTDQDFLKQMLGMLFAPGGTLSQKLVGVSLPMMYRGLKMLGMDPGAEFVMAMEEAERIGARVVYGDRDAQRTMRRLSESVDVQDLMRMMMGGGGSGMPEPPPAMMEFFSQQGDLESQVESMKTRAMVREMSEYMRRVNPRLATALIDERDAHMVESLSRLQGRVVGVVGLAHLDGIERRWEQLQYSGRALAR